MASAGGHWVKGSFQKADALVKGLAFPLGGGETRLSKAGMRAPEDLPPPSAGHVRLFTTLDVSNNLPSVEEKGLLVSYAREREFSGQMIWATSGPTDYSDARALVAFDVPVGDAEKVNRTDWIVSKDVPASKVIATYPMVTWSKHKGDPPVRWDKVMQTVKSYGKPRVLGNSGISDEVKSLIEETL